MTNESVIVVGKTRHKREAAFPGGLACVFVIELIAEFQLLCIEENDTQQQHLGLLIPPSQLFTLCKQICQDVLILISFN